MTELLLGCGSARDKRIAFSDETNDWTDLITLDFHSAHKPDVVHDLTVFPYPFDNNFFDEVHAYEVMEHLGQQGDFKFFFALWSELWRILKPDGLFCGTSPMRDSVWAWGDPGHTRIVSRENFVFLMQPMYDSQVGKTPMSDYRFCYQADFEPVHFETKGETLVYCVKAVKPSRCTVGKRKRK